MLSPSMRRASLVTAAALCPFIESPTGCGPRSRRNDHRDAETAERALRQLDVAAVAPGDVPGDGQAEAGAALVDVARVVEPIEGAEDRLVLLDRHALAV